MSRSSLSSIPNLDRSERNDNDSSAFFSTTETSNHFVTGSYTHNQEILESLEIDSVRDNVDEERLIYVATKKFTTGADANYQSRKHIVVSPRELNDNSSSTFQEGSSERQRPSESNEFQEGEPEIQRRSAGLRNFFMIFKEDASYMEVSREEIQRVRVMHKRFMEGSEFSFNYNVLLLIASVIAALGLGGNSVATIIASMLVSPLMGPVMGMAYGATILDSKLFYTALKSELLSLFACIVVGAIIGGCMIPFYDLLEEWPTDEMKSRSQMINFYLGIPIAFASGLGVAVSVLDEQTASLVGVAISASLLPPAINAGMLWVTYFFFDEGANEEHNFGVEGAISLGLTLVNILMIILSSMLMFRVKERMPIKKKRIFWTDLGLARKVYQNKALYSSDMTSPMRPMRRVGHRVSKFFRTSTTSEDLMNADRTAKPNNRTTSRASLDIPLGSDDAALRARALSTVVEGEERLEGYSSS